MVKTLRRPTLIPGFSCVFPCMLGLFASFGAACVPAAAPIPKPDAAFVADASDTSDAAVTDDGVAPTDTGVNPVDGGMDAGNGDSGPVDLGVPDTGIEDLGVPLPDRDNDGLPDETDPQPDTPNPILLDEPFDDLSNGWIFSSVSMRIDEQSSLLTVETLEALEREGWVGPQPAWGDYIVRARARVGSVGTANDSRSGHVGIIVRVQQVTPSRYLTCGVDLRRQEVVLAEHEGTQRTTIASMASGLALGEWFELRFTARGPNLSCGIAGQPLLTGRSLDFSSGSVGFRTYDSTFDADWLVVHDLPP